MVLCGVFERTCRETFWLRQNISGIFPTQNLSPWDFPTLKLAERSLSFVGWHCSIGIHRYQHLGGRWEENNSQSAIKTNDFLGLKNKETAELIRIGISSFWSIETNSSKYRQSCCFRHVSSVLTTPQSEGNISFFLCTFHRFFRVELYDLFGFLLLFILLLLYYIPSKEGIQMMF